MVTGMRKAASLGGSVKYSELIPVHASSSVSVSTARVQKSIGVVGDDCATPIKLPRASESVIIE
ncbi:MAG: hypothetical protein ACI89J_003536 [Hyphomicrobiaceae bacterium]|jgi:hypothetical protein